MAMPALPRSSRSTTLGCLDLLGAPTTNVGFAHVAWGLDGRDELKANIGYASDADNSTGNLAQDRIGEKEATQQNVDWTASESRNRDVLGGIELTNTTSNKREEEVGIARDLRRDLEFCNAISERCVVGSGW